MNKFFSIAIVALVALMVLGVNVLIAHLLITQFCWAGLLYIPMGLFMWTFPYLMYDFLLG